jgi:hypothetical protein
MGMGRPDEHRPGIDTAPSLDSQTRGLDEVSWNHQSIHSNQRHTPDTVVKHYRPDFACIVKLGVKRFAIPARFFHADLGTDVARGKSSFDWGSVRLFDLGNGDGESESAAQEAQKHDRKRWRLKKGSHSSGIAVGAIKLHVPDIDYMTTVLTFKVWVCVGLHIAPFKGIV